MGKSSHLTLKQIAQVISVHERTVTRWIDTGKVDIEKKKNRQGHLVFDQDDLKKLKAYSASITKVGN